MSRHKPSDQWRLGFALALFTALCWGTLPIKLKIALQQSDPITLTTWRFLVAFLGTFFYLLWKKRLPDVRRIPKQGWILLAIATAGLLLNYQLYLLGLQLTSPTNAQVLIQAAPFLFTLFSMLIFRERFSVLQWFGFATLLLGLCLFFDEQIHIMLDHAAEYRVGSLFVFAAAVTWAIYALAQKQLLNHLNSWSVMLFIYGAGMLIFLPFAHMGAIVTMDPLHIVMVILCGINAMVAYGAFAEALRHWEASKVSSVFAISPIVSALLTTVVSGFWPTLLQSTPLTFASILGAGLVVAGSFVAALGRRGARPPEENP